MACGVPVVASEVGGVPKVVGDTGILRPVGDVEGMAQAVWGLLADEDRRRALGAAARARAAEHFSAERVVPIYEAYYEEILSR